VAVATPFTVRAEAGFSCPSVEFALKAITAPVMPAPAASFKVAVTVALTPGPIELVGVRAMVMVGAAAVVVVVVDEVGVVPALQPVRAAIAAASKNTAENLVIF
jgi:hypothetical protein